MRTPRSGGTIPHSASPALVAQHSRGPFSQATVRAQRTLLGIAELLTVTNDHSLFEFPFQGWFLIPLCGEGNLSKIGRRSFQGAPQPARLEFLRYFKKGRKKPHVSVGVFLI